jgi:hypothetical protein
LIGLFTPSTPEIGRGFFDEFFKGMRELGYLERRDYGVEERFGEGSFGRLQSLADELVRLSPDVVVVGASVAALAVKKSTSSIPIVGVNLTDPVSVGLAASETRSGTNVTGTLIRVQIDPITRHSANFNVFALIKNRWNSICQCECCYVSPRSNEHCVGHNENDFYLLTRKFPECGLNVLSGARPGNYQANPEFHCSRLQFLFMKGNHGTGRIDHDADSCRTGHKFESNF